MQNLAVSNNMETLTNFLNNFYTFLDGDPRTGIILGLFFLGYVLKKIPAIPNQIIPAIVCGVGVIGTCFVVHPLIAAIFSGFTFAALAVFINELFMKYVLNALEDKLGTFVRNKLNLNQNNQNEKDQTK